MKKFWKRALLLTVAIGAATFCLGIGAALIGPSYSAIVNAVGLATWFYAMYKNVKQTIDENNSTPPLTVQIANPQHVQQHQNQRPQNERSDIRGNYREVVKKKNLGRWGRKNRIDDYQRAA